MTKRNRRLGFLAFSLVLFAGIIWGGLVWQKAQHRFNPVQVSSRPAQKLEAPKKVEYPPAPLPPLVKSEDKGRRALRFDRLDWCRYLKGQNTIRKCRSPSVYQGTTVPEYTYYLHN